MKQTTKRVEWILEHSTSARNSDIELYIQYFEQYVCENSEEAYFIRLLFERGGVNLASLTRIRAHIQNKEWQYMSDKQVKKFRDIKEVEKHNEYSCNNWKY